MKKITYLAIIAIILSSCDMSDKQAIPKTDGYSNLRITEYTYDGCEYVKFQSSEDSWGGHKGNCNNPIHKTK